MLTKLLPEQISRLWDIIRYAVEQSLPPVTGEHPDKMNRILSSALTGTVDVWALYTKKDDGNKLEGIGLTEILYDDVSGTKNLLIYSLYGYNRISEESYQDGIISLLKYAKSKGCLQIVAYTNSRQLVEVVNRAGGDTSYTFISFDIDKIVQKLNELNGG